MMIETKLGITKLETDSKYYKIIVHKDLFGHIILTRSWGSKFTRRSNFKSEIMPDQEATKKQINKIIHKRLSHNYAIKIAHAV